MQTSLFEREVDNTEKMRALRPRQEQAIVSVREAIRAGHKRIILQAPTGFGKCHGKGTQVIMFDGSLRNVEDIRVGDQLMGPDSMPRNVLSVTRGKGEMFEVKPVKGESFTCNDVHVLSLRRTKSWQVNGNRKGGRMRGGEIVNIPLNDYLLKSANFKHLHKLWKTGGVFFFLRTGHLTDRPRLHGRTFGRWDRQREPVCHNKWTRKSSLKYIAKRRSLGSG